MSVPKKLEITRSGAKTSTRTLTLTNQNGQVRLTTDVNGKRTNFYLTKAEAGWLRDTLDELRGALDGGG